MGNKKIVMKQMNPSGFYDADHITAVENRLQEYSALCKQTGRGEDFVQLSKCGICGTVKDKEGRHVGCGFCLLAYGKKVRRGWTRTMTCMDMEEDGPYHHPDSIRKVTWMRRRYRMLLRHIRLNGYRFVKGELRKESE